MFSSPSSLHSGSEILFLASQDALEVMLETEYLSVSTDLTDVTLVSDDTYGEKLKNW